MSLSYPVCPGDVIAGRYVVERLLGLGSSALVFSALHRQLKQQVAIKILRPDLARRPENGFRFRQQARVASSIEGEHVCRVLDISALEGGTPYVVMEYLEGRDLASEIAAERGRWPVADAVTCAIDACEALAEALAGGVVHADLEPSRFFRAERPDGTRSLKLLGLGAALIEPLTVPQWLTTQADPLISDQEARYLAPEQRTAPVVVDARSNVWTLGAILYELLSGRPISPRELSPLVAAKHASFSSWTDLASNLSLPQAADGEASAAIRFARVLEEDGLELPDGLASVLARALAPDPAERYASVAELARTLAPYALPEAQASAERIARLLPTASERRHGLIEVLRRRLLPAAAAVAVLGVAVHLLGHSSARPSEPGAHAFSADARLLHLANEVRRREAAASTAGSGLIQRAGGSGALGLTSMDVASRDSTVHGAASTDSGQLDSADAATRVRQPSPVANGARRTDSPALEGPESAIGAQPTASSPTGAGRRLVAVEPSPGSAAAVPSSGPRSHRRSSDFGGRR